MKLQIGLSLLAGALLGLIAGLHSPAEATDCGCLGERFHLKLVSGPEVPCADGSTDCVSEWVEAPLLGKSESGISGDLLTSGIVSFDTPGGE